MRLFRSEKEGNYIRFPARKPQSVAHHETCCRKGLTAVFVISRDISIVSMFFFVVQTIAGRIMMFDYLYLFIPVADRAQAEGLAGGGHSKIARVRAYYLYCMWLALLTSV